MQVIELARALWYTETDTEGTMPFSASFRLAAIRSEAAFKEHSLKGNLYRLPADTTKKPVRTFRPVSLLAPQEVTPTVYVGEATKLAPWFIAPRSCCSIVIAYG